MQSIRFALSICALALAGCATNPKPVTATACTTPAACDESPYKLGRLDPVPPRNDCPEGYAHFTDDRGTACWKADPALNRPPAACEPYRCPQSGYLLWECPETPPAGVAITRFYTYNLNGERNSCEYVQFENRGVEAVYAGCCQMRKIPQQAASGKAFFCKVAEDPVQFQIRLDRPHTENIQDLRSECVARIDWDSLAVVAEHFQKGAGVKGGGEADETRVVPWTALRAGVVCVVPY